MKLRLIQLYRLIQVMVIIISVFKTQNDIKRKIQSFLSLSFPFSGVLVATKWRFSWIVLKVMNYSHLSILAVGIINDRWGVLYKSFKLWSTPYQKNLNYDHISIIHIV